VSTTEIVDHGVFSEELFAVAEAEQEDEAMKVGSRPIPPKAKCSRSRHLELL
jgi:hypothetical protein